MPPLLPRLNFRLIIVMVDDRWSNNLVFLRVLEGSTRCFALVKERIEGLANIYFAKRHH